jgi:class 3 adenylate cyclase/tetratricopeptide (TPR) repeat protein
VSGLPGGAVTFLFTNIEGSTRLVKALREQYPRVLAEHRLLVRAAIGGQAGHEVDTQGDAFFAAFAGAKQAVLCALEIQRALAAHQWPAGAPVRVRIGIHTGQAVPAGGSYTGLAVHRAARICAAAAGGQVLVSQATQTIIEDEEEDPGFTLVDLGERELKDLDRPVRLFQLAAPGLEAPVPSPAGRPGGGAAAATRTLPRDIASFTGRQRELAELVGAVAGAAGPGGVVGVHAIGGMAGVGKTALAVHAAHQLADRFPGGQIFLPLHGHTPGQQPVGPADALASLLQAAGIPAARIPPGVEERMALWRDRLAGRRLLLVLDDAASSEQVLPLLPGAGASVVLVTSRRHLSALEDATAISLDTLPPGEAAGLLARLADRPGLGPEDPAVAEMTRLCGFLPLAIGMVARQLHHHPAWTAAGRAAELAVAAGRLELMATENLSVAAAFNLSYEDLAEDQRRLFRRLGLHPGPDIDGHAAAALDGTGLAAARRGLEALYDQYLLAEPAAGRYRMHDLIREHARALAAGDPADGDAALERLLDYYLHTALAAGQQLPTIGIDTQPLPPARPPEYAPPMSTPGQAVSWLEAERANLQAAAGYAAACGRPRHATLIAAAMAAFLGAGGYWDQALAVHRTAVDAARHAGDRPGQARALLLLAGPQFRTNDRAGAVASSQQALALYRDLGDRAGQAWALTGLGWFHQVASDYAPASACEQQALDLYRDLGDRAGQADALGGLGEVQQETADYRAAAASSRQALELYRDLGERPGQASALIGLGDVHRLTGDYPAATASLQQAQALNRDPVDRYAQAWIANQLGVLHRLAGDYRAAAASHRQALQILRQVGELAAQGYARNNLGLVQQETGDYRAAAASHQRALRLMRDAAEPYAQACVLNSLGELASRTSATGRARDYHGQALAIARQISAPLEEARALDGIGRSYLHDGDLEHGAAHLRQALTIYQRIGAPAAQQVQETLHDHGLTPVPAEPQPPAPGHEDHQPPAHSTP